MTALADLVAQWPAIATGITGLGGGGLLNRWWAHSRAKRKQTDDASIALVEQLAERLTRVEAEAQRERELCDTKISAIQHELNAVRHELRAESGLLDGMMLAVKHAPDKATEIVAEVQARRVAALRTRPTDPAHPETMAA
jgi:hypothetical protein